LRRGLDRAGLDRTEVNIWEDPQAAARVRSVAGGHETVPTVVVGDVALVNPTVAEVITAVGVDGLGRTSTRSDPSFRRLKGAGWSLAAAAVWGVLATANPTTTYHLAPLLVSFAWPAAAAGSTRDRRPGVPLVVAGGVLIALVTAVLLAVLHALRGPALLGGTAVVESLVMIAVGAAASGLWATWRRIRGLRGLRSRRGR
jgi:glutaredoxin